MKIALATFLLASFSDAFTPNSQCLSASFGTLSSLNQLKTNNKISKNF